MPALNAMIPVFSACTATPPRSSSRIPCAVKSALVAEIHVVSGQVDRQVGRGAISFTARGERQVKRSRSRKAVHLSRAQRIEPSRGVDRHSGRRENSPPTPGVAICDRYAPALSKRCTRALFWCQRRIRLPTRSRPSPPAACSSAVSAPAGAELDEKAPVAENFCTRSLRLSATYTDPSD